MGKYLAILDALETKSSSEPTTLFRRNNRPALGPLGDSLHDINPGWRK